MAKIKGKTMWVVKIGGSLMGSPELPYWLSLFAKFSDGKVIIVPGGGVFADAVRDAQKISNISDATAHRLAVLAMDQYGLLLASMNPLLATARTECEIDERTWQHRGIVWLPSKMVLSDDSIPQKWDVTSDSLAAWLANKLGAQHLVLLKSEKTNSNELSIKAVTDNGMVDLAFADFVQDKAFAQWILHKSDYTYFEDGINADKLKEHASALG
jgi:5-(aminomethyl)-3-furanmethanol phosphate kinase